MEGENYNMSYFYVFASRQGCGSKLNFIQTFLMILLVVVKLETFCCHGLQECLCLHGRAAVIVAIRQIWASCHWSVFKSGIGIVFTTLSLIWLRPLVFQNIHLINDNGELVSDLYSLLNNTYSCVIHFLSMLISRPVRFPEIPEFA